MSPLDEQYAAIMTALPATADRADAEKVLIYCGTSIGGGVDWPSWLDIAVLQGVAAGFGCWMHEIGKAIDTAELDPSARREWRVAWNGCKAMLLRLHVLEKQKSVLTETSTYRPL